jgi:hypothetical protein
MREVKFLNQTRFHKSKFPAVPSRAFGLWQSRRIRIMLGNGVRPQEPS